MLRLKQEEEENQPTRYSVAPPPVQAQSSTTEAELRAYIQAAAATGTAQAQKEKETQATAAPPTVIEWYHHLVTNNPVFHKETLAQQRVHEKKQGSTRTTERALAWLAVVGLYVGFFYLLGKIWGLPNESERSSSGWILHTFLTIIQFLVMVLALPLQAATMITQEREKMTWNALLLSRLSPLQILVGKGAAALRPLWTTFALLLPALILSAFAAQITLKGIVAAQVILLLTAVLNTSIALCCSLFGKKSAQASGNAGGAVMLTLLGFPAITGLLQAGPWIAYTLMNGGSSYGYVAPEWFNYLAAAINVFNPAVATFFGLTAPSTIPGLPLWLWFLVPTVYVLAAAGTTWAIWQKMLGQFWKAPKDFSG